MELLRNKIENTVQREIYWRMQFNVADVAKCLGVCSACCSVKVCVVCTPWPVRENAAQVLEALGSLIFFVNLGVCLEYCGNWRVAQLQSCCAPVLVAAYLSWVV